MRARRIGCAVLVAALAAFLFFTRGPAPAAPVPPGTFVFGVMGDAPYTFWDDRKWPLLLGELRANRLEFMIDVGDIFWRPCTDEHYSAILRDLNSLPYPVMYTPGDNESFDCWERLSGAFPPQGRWASIRRIFFADPSRSLGGRPVPVAHQAGELVENARWTSHGIVFATVDIIGSRNGMAPFPGRTAEDDAASRRRTEAAAAWMRETFAEAARANAPAVVVAFHANMHTETRNDFTQAFDPFLSALEQEAARFAKPVIVVHGDGHDYLVDHPFRAANMTRMQVPGSPLVGWVRVVVRPGALPAFTFEEHHVPRWKYF